MFFIICKIVLGGIHLKLSEIIDILSAEACTNNIEWDLEIEHCRASDLLSDVLTFPAENCLLLTGLANCQVIRTAEMMDIQVIIFVRNKKPSQEMLNLAIENNIALFSTKYQLYSCCGLLYKYGLEE